MSFLYSVSHRFESCGQDGAPEPDSKATLQLNRPQAGKKRTQLGRGRIPSRSSTIYFQHALRRDSRCFLFHAHGPSVGFAQIFKPISEPWSQYHDMTSRLCRFSAAESCSPQFDRHVSFKQCSSCKKVQGDIVKNALGVGDRGSL